MSKTDSKYLVLKVRFKVTNDRPLLATIETRNWSNEAIFAFLGIFVMIACAVGGTIWKCWHRRSTYVRRTLRFSSRLDKYVELTSNETEPDIECNTSASTGASLVRRSYSFGQWNVQDVASARQRQQEQYDTLLHVRKGRF